MGKKTPWGVFPRCRLDWCDLQLIQFCNQFIPLFQIHVSVGTEKHNLIGMAEAVGNGLGGNAHVKEQGGMGVAEVVEADMRLEVVSLLRIAEISADATGRPRKEKVVRLRLVKPLDIFREFLLEPVRHTDGATARCGFRGLENVADIEDMHLVPLDVNYSPFKVDVLEAKGAQFADTHPHPEQHLVNHVVHGFVDQRHELLELLLRPEADGRILVAVGIPYRPRNPHGIGGEAVIPHRKLQHRAEDSACVNGGAFLVLGNQLLVLPCANHDGGDVLDGLMTEGWQNTVLEAVGCGLVAGGLVPLLAIGKIKLRQAFDAHVLAAVHLADELRIVLLGLPLGGKAALLDLLIDSFVGAVAENRIPFPGFFVFVLAHDVILLLFWKKDNVEIIF